MADSPFALPEDEALAYGAPEAAPALPEASSPDLSKQRTNAALAALASIALFTPTGKLLGLASKPLGKALMGAGVGAGIAGLGAADAQAQKTAKKEKEGAPVKVTPTITKYTPFEIGQGDPHAQLKQSLNDMFAQHADLSRQAAEEEKKQVGPSGGRGPNWRGLQERITGLEGDIREGRKLLARQEREAQQPGLLATWGPSAAGAVLGGALGFGAAGPAIRRAASRYTDFNSMGSKLEENLAKAAAARAPIAGKPLGNEMTANVNVANKLGYAKEPFTAASPFVKEGAGTMPGPFEKGQPWLRGSGSRLDDAIKNPTNWLSGALTAEGLATNALGGGFDSTRRPEDVSPTDQVLQAVGRGSLAGAAGAKIGGILRKGLNLGSMKAAPTALAAEKAARMRMIQEYTGGAAKAAPEMAALEKAVEASRPGFKLPTGAQGDLAAAGKAAKARRDFLAQVHQDPRVAEAISALQGRSKMMLTPARLHLELAARHPEGLDGLKINRKLAAEILNRRPPVPGSTPWAPPIHESPFAATAPAKAANNGSMVARARELLENGRTPSQVARELGISERDLAQMFPGGY